MSRRVNGSFTSIALAPDWDELEPSIVEILERGANDGWHLGLTRVQLSQFARFSELLEEWNTTRFNLTRIVAPREVAVKHFLDSLAPFTVFSIPENASVIDVGTGAGLPGLAWKIFRPELALTLLDSTKKKLEFCRAVAADLQMRDVRFVHARAEDAGRMPEFAGAYDIVTARAVAALERLLPLMAPFARSGGRLIALKGSSVADEMPGGRRVASKLGLSLAPPDALFLPEALEPTERQIVIATRR